MLHKTDGSYVNRPFFRCRQDVQETAFPPKDILSRSVFCFFSSRKEIVPPSFLSRKKRKQKKVICGTVASLRFCCSRQRAMQNGRFVCEPSVFSFRAGRAGKHLFSERHPLPQCLLFLFFKKRNRPPFQKKRKRPLERSRSLHRARLERDPPKNCLSRADMLHYKL